MKNWKQIKTALKHNRLIFTLLHPLHRAHRELRMRYAQRRWGVQGNKVVFRCFDTLKYCDNPRYISERLHTLRPDSDIVWLFNKKVFDHIAVPDYVRKVPTLSPEGLRELATARFWVSNYTHNTTLYLNTEKQYYIQTWHGDRGFKRVGLDNNLSERGKPTMEERCAMMIAGSRFGANTYRTAFRYRGEILMDGCPRNDPLIKNDPDEVRAIRSRLGLDGNVRVMMYAPTYRDFREGLGQKGVLDVSRTLDHLVKTTHQRWIGLCRAHYKNTSLILQDDSRIMDVSGYPEMTDLLLVTDLLVTDYSSCGGDFALLNRPVFLYHADVEEYNQLCRGFYFDVTQSPFLIAHSQEELEKLIDSTDEAAARANCQALNAFFGTTETGHAADAVCRYIIDRMDEV